MLFCLVKGKKRTVYTKLLRLVEEIATENGTTIFRRPVTLMCDFEAPFIKAVRTLYKSVTVKCCFFHFTKNIHTEGQPVVKDIERAVGQTSETYRMAQLTKRRLMLLPLLPEELAIPEVLGIIHCAWTDACPDHLHAFDELIARVIRTYIGTPPGDPAPVRPRFHQSIWSASGMSVRTNNGAESLNALLNAEVKGKVSLYGFLSIIEGQMMRGRERIQTGCESQSRAVEETKNRLLAEELHKLLNGEEGVLCFLDNCASITLLESLPQARGVELVSTTTSRDEAWIEANGGLLATSACGLYRRLRPEGQLADDAILANVRTWAFRVLEPIAVEDGFDEELIR